MAYNPFAPKQEEKAKADKLQGFFKGSDKPKSDDLYSGSILLDPLRGLAEFGQQAVADNVKFAGAVAAWAGDDNTAALAKDIAGKIEYEKTRGWEAKGRGVYEYPLYHPRKLARMLGGVGGSVLSTYGGGAGATKLLMKAGMKGKLAREIGFTLAGIPLATMAAGQHYEGMTKPVEEGGGGKTPQEAMLTTVSLGIGMGALERYVPLTWWMSKATGAKRVFSTIVQETGEEAAQQIWTNAHKVIGWKGTKDIYHTMMDGMAESIVGGIMGGGLAGSVDLASPRVPKVEVSPETTQQVFEMFTARGVKNDAGDPVTVEDVQSMMKVGINKIYKEENSIIKRLFKTRGLVANVDAMLEARQDETAYEQATLEKDPKTGENVIKMHPKGDTSKKYGPVLGKMVDDAVKSGKTPNKAEIDSLFKAEQSRKRTVIDAYEKLQYVAGGEHVEFSKLPVAMQTIIENEGPSNPIELQGFVDELMNDPNVMYFMGGESDSERAEIFYGPLMQNRRQGWRDGKWTKGQVSPYAWIRDMATFMAVEGIDPSTITIRGDENTEAAFKTLLDAHSQVNLGIPAEKMATKSQEELNVKKGLDPTEEGKAAGQEEFSFVNNNMKLTQGRIDEKVAAGMSTMDAASAVNREMNEERLSKITEKDKMRSDESKLNEQAGENWDNYKSPAEFIKKMKAVMNDMWQRAIAKDKSYSKRNSLMYQALRDRVQLNFMGMPMGSVTEAIELATLFRNPFVEVNQVIYVKDGKLIKHSAHSVNSPTNATVSMVAINEVLKTTGADGFYIVHNHPSGNPEFSARDVKTALKYKMASDGRADLAFTALKGKYLGLAATDGENYNFIDSQTSDEAHNEYITTDQTSRPYMRELSPEVKAFSKNYKTDQIQFQQTGGSQESVFNMMSKIMLDAKNNFHKGKTTIIFGDSDQRFLTVEYLESSENMAEQIGKSMMENKASTYTVLTEDQSRTKLAELEKMPSGMLRVIVTNPKALTPNAQFKDVRGDMGTEKWKALSKKILDKNDPFTDPELLPPLLNEQEDTFLGDELNLSPDQKQAQDRLIKAKQEEDDYYRQLEADEKKYGIDPEMKADVQDDPYVNIPPITREKIDSMNNVGDIAVRLREVFKKAYDSNDADTIRMLEENLEAYMEESEEGINSRQEKSAQEEFARTGESQIIDAMKDSYSKARSIAAGAGRRAETLRKTIKSLETIRTLNPGEAKEVSESIRNRKKALSQVEMVQKSASKEVAKNRRLRIKDDQANATSIQITNPMSVQDLQTKDTVTLPPGTYELIRFANNPDAVKIQGLGFQVDVNASVMRRWAASDVQFVKDDEAKLKNGLASEPRDQIHAGQTDPFAGPPIVEREAPTPAARRFGWKLKVLLRVGKFLGNDEADMVKALSRYNKKVLKTDPETGEVTGGAWTVLENDTDQKALQDIVDQALQERNYSGFAEMVGRIAEDIVIQQVNDYITKEMPHLEGVDKQDYLRDLLYAMNFAAEEVIVSDGDASRYVYSNKGYTHYFKDGQIPGKLDSEKDSNIKHYIEIHKRLKGSEPDPAILSMMKGDQYRRGMRPEAMYWSLLPKHIQNTILWQKANVEDPMFFKLLNSDVLSRAPNLQNRLNGFTHHAWRKDPDTPQESVSGGKQTIGSQRQPPRTYDTYAEFVEATNAGQDGVGLEAMVNYGVSVREYTRNSLVSAFQRETIQKMVNVVDPDTGLPIVTWQNDKYILSMLEAGASPERIERFLTRMGYKQMANAEGLALRSKGAFFRPWVKADVADVLDQFYSEGGGGKVTKSWNKFNGIAKRLIMSSPYQFAMQIVSSPALWYKNPVTAIREAIAPLMPQRVAAGMIEEQKNLDKPFKRMEDPHYDLELVELFVKKGLKTFNIELVLNSLYDHKVMDDHPLLRGKYDEHMETLIGKAGLDKYIFNQYIAKNMYNYTKLFYEKGLEQGLSKDQAAAEAVKFSSDTSGMLNRNIYGSEGPFLQATLFARDFTVSFFRQLTGASFNIWQGSLHGYKTKGPGSVMNSFLHAEASPETMSRMQGYYAAHLARIFAAKILFLGAAQFALSFFIPPEEKKKEDPWMLLNPDIGKQFMVKMPYKGDSDEPIYIDPLMWREMNQIIGMFPGLSGRGPLEFVKGKLNVGISQVFDQVSNSDFKGDAITGEMGDIGFGQWAKDRILHVGKQVLPPFARGEVRGMSNLSAVVGMPQKRGVNWGPGGSQGKADQTFKVLGRAQYRQDQVQQKMKKATNKELLKMYLNREISQEQYENQVWMRKMKYYEILKRNRSKIFKQKIRDKK